MYLDLFKLSEQPFRLTPDPDFLYLSSHHARARSYMESTLWFADGFVVITGEIGSGKTTLLQSFLESLDDSIVTAKVAQTQLTPVQFLQTVLAEFGFRPFKKRKAELLDMLNMFLVEQYTNGKKVIILIDEAQNLSKTVLEEIRLLSGIETQKDKILRIIICGQPELNQTLDSPEMRQLAQRVRLRLHLGPMDLDETRAYILHRLNVAGANGREIFDDDAIKLIFRYSGGIPRLTNTLCDTSMICAYADDIDFIDGGRVQTAIDELNWSEFTSQTNRFSVKVPVLERVDEHPVGQLSIKYDGHITNELPLHPGRMIIGRTADNDLQIDSKYISRHHAQIITGSDGRSVLEDLNSTNGILVGNRKVKRRKLSDGDTIALGQHSLIYHRQKKSDTANVVQIDGNVSESA